MKSDPPGGVLDVARLWRATRYSVQGLRAVFQHEAAFRQELAAAALLVPAALALALLSPVSWSQCALLIGSVLLVLLVELLNSAIESVVDRISEDNHALSGRAKDAGSAAVLVSLVICLVVWTLVLIDAFAG
ncbi:MAG: diacylglycerol kinase [Gammaproteobacteria bacterium]|nr:diacylglycerol kinase [Gammaproteobacteria bacterium]NIM73796.1 diacylglycerol kinase [Gammaproteobacteria bacterium]NIN39373.1 diacylglycerol kinase [Gammaproteobacteria bacterium]NIO25038.1 diacylglycerol kinase [Gammaproteobacteria bacterium]NIO65670.1 diacylglycerol kinase [Gammaproteobacteria bacterium]